MFISVIIIRNYDIKILDLKKMGDPMVIPNAH